MNLNRFKKDFVWYSFGAAIPMIIGFIKAPIFTRYYSPADYGYLTLISTTYSYINLFGFSWLLSCVWRYYVHEKNSKELNKFYTNIIVLFFIGFIITSIITLIWSILSNDIIIRKLIIANYINLITTSITGIYFIIIRLDGKSLIYNIYNVIMSVVSFMLLLILAFILKSSIAAMINCSNIVNIVILAFIIYKFNKHYRISKNDISKKVILELTSYGFATVFLNMSILLLTSGDRYVINIFYSKDKVGIYNQIYGLAQISIIAISDILKNIINPYQFKLFEEDINNEEEFYKYIILYIICMLPFTVYFSIYSKQIASLLLGEKFRIGYKMMPYIMISCFLFELSDMHETRMRFKNKMKKICFNVITASVINIILNFIFIPLYGYNWAAVTTLISYIVLYGMDIYFDFSAKDKFVGIFKSKARITVSIFIILSLQILMHYFLVNKINYCSTITYSIMEGTIFLISYIFYICFKLKKEALSSCE